jgi:hypothetical protein
MVGKLFIKKEKITKMEKEKSLVDCLVEKSQECDRLKDALKNIFANTVNRPFNDDYIYKMGVMGNIEVAVGKEQFEDWEDLYRCTKD